MPPSILPAETTDHIIDFLWNNQPTLVKCALTCKSWVPSSRLHLYLRPSISSDSALLAFLRAAETPEIKSILKRAKLLSLSGIQELCLIDDLSLHCPHIETFECDRLHFGQSVQTFAAVLRGCTRWIQLRSLKLDRSTSHDYREIVQLICAFPSLSRLSCDAVYVHDQEAPTDVPSAANGPALEVLELGLASTVVPHYLSMWLLAGPTRKSVRDLRLYMVGDPAAAAAVQHDIEGYRPRVGLGWILLVAMIEATRESLEALTLTGFNVYAGGNVAGMGFKACLALRSLHLNFEIWNEFNVQFLGSTASLRNVQHLSIAQVVDRSRCHDWDAWSSTFSHRQYAELQRFSLSFTVVASPEEHDSVVRRLERGVGGRTMHDILEEMRKREVRVLLDITRRAPPESAPANPLSLPSNSSPSTACGSSVTVPSHISPVS